MAEPLLQKLFSDDFLRDEIKLRRREMFIVTDCTSFTVFTHEQNALHFAHAEGTRESAVYYKHSAATRPFQCAPTSGDPKGTFAAKPMAEPISISRSMISKYRLLVLCSFAFFIWG